MSAETGAAALAALARRSPNEAPAAALRDLLRRRGGNVSAAARNLGVSRRTLLAAVDALGLTRWLSEAWPDRRAGGAGVARRGQDDQPPPWHGMSRTEWATHTNGIAEAAGAARREAEDLFARGVDVEDAAEEIRGWGWTDDFAGLVLAELRRLLDGGAPRGQ